MRPRSFFQRPLPTRPWCAAPLRSGELMLAVTMQSPRFLVRTLTHPMTANERTNPAGTCALMRAHRWLPRCPSGHTRAARPPRVTFLTRLCVCHLSPHSESSSRSARSTMDRALSGSPGTLKVTRLSSFQKQKQTCTTIETHVHVPSSSTLTYTEPSDIDYTHAHT